MCTILCIFIFAWIYKSTLSSIKSIYLYSLNVISSNFEYVDRHICHVGLARCIILELDLLSGNGVGAALCM